MSYLAIRRSFALGDGTLVDRWLRFAPAIQARYEAEQHEQRVRDLRSAVLVGIALYNVYNFTSIALLADVLWISVVLRVAVVTPVSLALIWLIGRTTPLWAERLVLIGVLNAYLLPIFLFWLTEEPLGLFTFAELTLIVVFANMLLALRFRHAAAFTAAAFGASLLALLAKGGVAEGLQFALAVQLATACVFSLYSNHRLERRRCRDYLAAPDATLQAENANVARLRFQDLSRTDALTGLPNRLLLTERLDEWFAGSEAIALMMIDIDHFKLYNDALGHPAGDECLQRVADVFAAAGQTESRFCARFGGEDFTFAVRGVTELEAVRLAKGLVLSVEAQGIVHPSRSDGPGVVTISLGLAIKPRGIAASPAGMFAAADRALYLAKQRGRNRFVIDDGGADGIVHNA
ncbi:MAG: GGDEF domain-containing protein [Aurantimonas endophytica]|uniref:GGDEF domain-containing protein n=1 Tax=Aurantimonas endophytica TaxID=1522175 RepID=UPI0030039640